MSADCHGIYSISIFDQLEMGSVGANMISEFSGVSFFWFSFMSILLALSTILDIFLCTVMGGSISTRG